MIVRMVWQNYDFRNMTWYAAPIDAFWVEATLEEAEKRIFPILATEKIERSKGLAIKNQRYGNMFGYGDHIYCFLVARDLSSIDSFRRDYPVSQMWNGDSPFRPIPLKDINDLKEVENVVLPKGDLDVRD